MEINPKLTAQDDSYSKYIFVCINKNTIITHNNDWLHWEPCIKFLNLIFPFPRSKIFNQNPQESFLRKNAIHTHTLTKTP